MLKRTCKGHFKEVNLPELLISGQVVWFCFLCFWVCLFFWFLLCFVFVFFYPRSTQMLSLTSSGPPGLKGLSSNAEAKDKKGRSDSIQEFPSPVMPADLDKKGGGGQLAGSQAH